MNCVMNLKKNIKNICVKSFMRSKDIIWAVQSMFETAFKIT